MNTEEIGFIGLGLIGGSIAKAIKEYYPQSKLYACAGHESTIKAAYDDGLIENDKNLPMEEFAKMDMIFLCCPLGTNIDYLRKLKPFLDSHTLLTDVGSVKGDIEKEIHSLGLSPQFIGGHPMTGSEKTGYGNSDALILENAYYVLTPSEENDEKTVRAFTDMIRSLKAIPLVMPSNEHDRATAAISHLPHVIASVLVNMVRQNDTENETMKTLAAGGFRDITRIASSSPVMWEHICIGNKDEIHRAIVTFQELLNQYHEAILETDEAALDQLFQQSKDYRDNLYKQKSGLLPKTCEFYLELSDEAGGIATIATLLAGENISIKNIGIVHNREFEQGVLRIEVYDTESMNHAIRLLDKDGYVIHRAK